MRTSSRTVAVLLFDEVELLDVAGPVQVLSSAGRNYNYRPFKIQYVAREVKSVVTRNQTRLETQSSLSDCRSPELLLIPGGYGARRAVEDPAIIDFVVAACKSAGLVAAVGWGVALLARAGRLAGTEVAATKEVASVLAEIDASVTALDQALVSSASLVTAAHSAATLDLGLEIVAHVLGFKLALATAIGLGHTWLRAGSPDPEALEILSRSDRPR